MGWDKATKRRGFIGTSVVCGTQRNESTLAITGVAEAASSSKRTYGIYLISPPTKSRQHKVPFFPSQGSLLMRWLFRDTIAIRLGIADFIPMGSRIIS